MIIFIGWTTKKEKKVRICLAWGKDDGACNPKLDSSIFNGGSDGDVSVLVNNRKFASNEMSIMSDSIGRYGRISEMATELAFNKGCNDKEITKLSEIHIENKKTNERISMESLIALLKNNIEGHEEGKGEKDCSCSI